MRAITTIKSAASLAAAAVLLAACSTPMKTADNTKGPAVVVPQANGGAGTGDTRVIPVDIAGNNGFSDAANRSVYFDFDQYIVKSEFAPVVNSNAKNLSVNKGKKILIQGNTDERGGREYNLALGQKRAEAVRKSMALLGVPDAQMEAVSLGKEKPRAMGSDEASWAENRRADILYSGK
ncbi:peptidoglycan-associated lipoprotein Pal [Undibacterium sp. Di27W]|uniref:peptidoglycan-associated lipoprotein Pal n=1 Tax=Undibacterium sp. Di27W TaxID=3413036 RepID=UPI003BEFEF78